MLRSGFVFESILLMMFTLVLMLVFANVGELEFDKELLRDLLSNIKRRDVLSSRLVWLLL